MMEMRPHQDSNKVQKIHVGRNLRRTSFRTVFIKQSTTPLYIPGGAHCIRVLIVSNLDHESRRKVSLAETRHAVQMAHPCPTATFVKPTSYKNNGDSHQKIYRSSRRVGRSKKEGCSSPLAHLILYQLPLRPAGAWHSA